VAIFISAKGTLSALSGVCFFQAEEIMFRDALLESSSVAQRRSPWPMATAFTLEFIAASVLIVLPLVSTGIISLTTHVSLPVPPSVTPLENSRPVVHASGPRTGIAPRPEIVPVANSNPVLVNPWAKTTAPDVSTPTADPRIGSGNSNTALPDLAIKGDVIQPPVLKRIVVSHSMEARLINKVVPEYPQIAKISGVQGDVKLHAIIGTDGTVQSLTAISGNSLLVPAAKNAVQQWRYQPYILNGQAVEVETFITVTFRRTN
jgi:protein TonB